MLSGGARFTNCVILAEPSLPLTNPQVCSKYGLQVGAASAPVMKVLMVVCAPVAYPISTVLDRVLGASHMVPLRRVELQALFELEQEQVRKK
jgi:metal transporter CNNM